MKVLIADDESIIRLGLKKMLQDMGHEVYVAVNGREALNFARQYSFDLAILDIKMPFTDGLQAAQTIGRTRPIPVLILTAFNEQDLIERATDLPIHGYLIKPIKPADLMAAMAIAYKRFEESQTLAEQNERLTERLEARKVVEQAKGILMTAGMSEDQAYEALRKQARRNQVTIQAVATTLLKNT